MLVANRQIKSKEEEEACRKEERRCETNLVYSFICGLNVRVEDLVHFRQNNNLIFIS
jgi:hypothetical protein